MLLCRLLQRARPPVQYFDLYAACDEKTKTDFLDKRIPTAGGTIGLYFAGYKFYVKSIAMTAAVSSDWPEATSVEPLKEFTSKVIPMNALTKLDLSKYLIDGVRGDLFTWTSDSENVSVSDGYILAYAKGAYTLTGNYNGKKTEIYVVVKEETETEWTVYDKTFTENAIPEEWHAQYYFSNGSKFADITSTYTGNLPYTTNVTGIVPFDYASANAKATAVGAGGAWVTYGYLTLDNDVVSALQDYTIEVEMINHTRNYGFGTAIFARAITDENGKIYASTSYDAVFDCKAGYKEWLNRNGAGHLVSTGMALTPTYNIDNNSWKYVGLESSSLAKYNVKYSGSTVTFWSPEDAANVFTVNGITERSGAVGIVTNYVWDNSWGSTPLLHAFRVKLNTKEGEQPKAEKMNIYKVTDASPAIPMNAMTVVNASDLLVEIDGTAYLGSQVTFVTTTTTDGLKIENGEIKAYRAGLYPVTVNATDNSRKTHTRTIYVVVKERTESEWVIYSQTFGDLGVTSNDTVKVSDVLPGWQSQLFTSQYTVKYPIVDGVKGDGIGDKKLIYVNYEYLPKYNYMLTWQGTPFKGLAAPGVIPFANYYSYGFTEGKLNYFDSATNTGYKYSLWDGTGLFTLSNSVVSQFSDYTVTSNMYSHVAFDGAFGSGVFGRMTVNSNGLIDNNSGEYSLFFTSNKLNNGNVYTRNIKGEGVNPSTTKISTDAWTYAKSSDDAQVSLSVKYSGTTATMFSAADSEKKTFTIDNVPQVKGGVGVVTQGVGDQQNNGCFVNIKEFKVTLNDTEDTMPASTDVVDPTDAKVLKNTVYNLANYKVDDGVMGYSAQFDSVVTSVGEVAHNKLVAFSAGTIDITANYSDSEGQTTSKVITITVVENTADANVISNPLFDSSLTIAPVTGVNGRYYVTVTAPSGMQLENGVIALDDNGTKSVINATQDATGVKFAFNTADITAVKLEPSFIAEKEAYLNGLGATIRLASAGKETGIRFGFRTSVLKGDGQVSYIADDATLENNDCEILEIGTIILPTALIPANEELNINTAKARKVVTSSLVLSSAAYSDFASVLVGIPTTNYDTDVSARGYLKVKVNGTEQYIYSDVVTRSYNDVLSAIYPAGNKTGTNVMFEDVFTGGTNHQMDSDPASNDLTYEIGEEITFSFAVKGGYKLNYKLYKDDAEQNLYGNESVITEYVWNNKTSKSDLPYNCCVLSGSANDGILKVTTKMKQAGMVKLYVQVLGENNAEITNFTSSVAVDFDNITQNSASVLEKSELETFYNTLTSGADLILAKVQEEVESETFTNFWANRSETSNYDGTYIKIRALGKRGGEYLAYDVQIATDETVKTQSTGENGLFAYTDYNTRPASGILVVPVNAAASSLGIDADFQGYGCGSAGTNNMGSGVFTLHMNSHGFLNDQTTEYYNKHNTTSPENGGVSGFDFTAAENAETDATKLYFYGMLKRDYVGLQFVKMLPEFNLSKGITTRGGSQGGFQSVAVGAMDSDVKTVNATYCWMGTLGGYESGDIMSTFMPFVTDARKYYNTAGLAKLLGSDVKLVLETGLGDYTAPPQGVISIYNAASCTKSIRCVQYWEHGPVRANNSYASIKSYEVQ